MALAKYNKSCAVNTPGNQNLFIAEVANITSITIASGEVTAITGSATGSFKEIGADLDTIQRIENATAKNSTVIDHQLIAKFSKGAKNLQTLRKSLADAMPCGVVAIVLDGNGQAWLCGWGSTNHGTRPFRNMTDNFDTGLKPEDDSMNMATITLQGSSADYDIPLDSTLTAGVVAGTSTFIDWN